MAKLAEDDCDKALWLRLAQSWIRLAEHVARAQMRKPQRRSAMAAYNAGSVSATGFRRQTP
jgi:hypothetical protein